MHKPQRAAHPSVFAKAKPRVSYYNINLPRCKARGTKFLRGLCSGLRAWVSRRPFGALCFFILPPPGGRRIFCALAGISVFFLKQSGFAGIITYRAAKTRCKAGPHRPGPAPVFAPGSAGCFFAAMPAPLCLRGPGRGGDILGPAEPFARPPTRETIKCLQNRPNKNLKTCCAPP